MSLRRSPFAPPAALRGPHVQSVLSSSPLRALQARRRLRQAPALHETVVLDLGGGIRLQGVVTGGVHCVEIGVAFGQCKMDGSTVFVGAGSNGQWQGALVKRDGGLVIGGEVGQGFP